MTEQETETQEPTITVGGITFSASEVEYVRIRREDGTELRITPPHTDPPQMGFVTQK